MVIIWHRVVYPVKYCKQIIDHRVTLCLYVTDNIGIKALENFCKPWIFCAST